MNPEGRSRVENEVVDQSFLVQAGVGGIPALIGPTEWGDPTKSVLLGSLADYEKYFGGIVEGNTFPAQVQRMLKKGASVRLARAVQYANPADASTIQGKVAYSEIGIPDFIGVKPVWSGALKKVGVANNTYTFLVGNKVIAVFNDISNSTDPLGIVTAMESFFLTITGWGFKDNGLGNFEITYDAFTDEYNAEVVTVTSNNNYAIFFTPTIADGSAITGAGFDLTTDGENKTFEMYLEIKASTVGTWGNKVGISIAPASSGNIDMFDATVTVEGHPSLAVTVTELNDTITAADITKFTQQTSHLVKVLDWTGTMNTISKVLLLTGLDTGTVSTLSYMGDETAGTGIRVFDGDVDFIRIAAPMVADPQLDQALVDYAVMRGDCRAWTRTPMYVGGRVAVDYRKGTGIYTHSPIDTWRASMVYGDLLVSIQNPADLSKFIDTEIHALTGVLANACVKDTDTFNWFTTAGSERGVIGNNNGVRYNLGTAARATEFDIVDKAGINAVIKDKDFGTVYWGNGTLQAEKTLLSNENIAELLIYFSRVINPIAKSKLFNPNDPATWIQIYQRVDAIGQFVKESRGVYDYDYQGDQFVTDITKVLVNTPAGLDAGLYEFHFFIKPTPAMKYVGIKTIVSNSGASFELL